MRRIFLALALLSSAASPATLPSIQISDATALEGKTLSFKVKLIGTRTTLGHLVYFTISDGTAKANTDYYQTVGSFTIPPTGQTTMINVQTIDNSNVDGTRKLAVKITHGADLRCYDCSAVGTITDDDVAPPPPPTPAPISTGWKPAPLTVGGYAWLKNQGACCNGLIVRLISATMSSEADAAKRQHIWVTQFVADPSGNYPASNPYWLQPLCCNNDEGLQGIAPTP